MVNAGRVACITTPFLLSLAALVCLVLIFLAGTIHRNDTVDDFYFLKINLANLTLSSTVDVPGTDIAVNLTDLSGVLQTAKQALNVDDYYTIYLRNYCGWNGNNKYSNCSSPESYFWFNPVKVWGLENTGVNVKDLLPSSVRAGLDTYEAASKATFILYVVALSATSATLLVGFSALFSRWGSFFTTFFAVAAGITFAAASGVATAMFYVLKGVLNKELKKEIGITSDVGHSTITLTWIGSAFAVGAGFFWFLSICCCSGRSPYNPGSREARRTRAEKTPYIYERVGSPYLGPSNNQNVPLNSFQTHPAPSQSAYEPFRAQHV